MSESQNLKKYLNVEYNQAAEDSLNPSLILFPHNHPNIDTLNNIDNTKFAICESNEALVNKRKIILGETPRIIYNGESKKTNNLSEYVIGVFSKKKRKISFYDIDNIFTINQKVRRIENHYQQVQAREAMIQETSQNKPDYFTKKINLISDFGTMKAKKAAENMRSQLIEEKNISSLDAMNEILDERVAQEEAIEKEKISKNLQVLELLPIFNPQVSELNKLDEIFNFEEQFEQELAAINHKPVLKMCKVSSVLNENKHLFSEFVFNYLQSIVHPILVDQKNATKKIKKALLLDYMIKFYYFNKKVINKSPEEFVLEEIKSYYGTNPELIGRFLFDRYTQSGFHLTDDNRVKYVKTLQTINKNIIHICVYALHLYQYKMDYTLLRQSLNIQEKDMAKYFFEIGCVFKDPRTKAEKEEDEEEMQASARKNKHKKTYVKLESLKLNKN
jgi:hypothetical protein